MYGLNYLLAQREDEGNPIQVALVGAGQMGRGLVAQMQDIKGMKIGLLADLNVELAVSAMKGAGVDADAYQVVSSVEEANAVMAAGKTAITADSGIAAAADLVECVVDATGIPDVGARVAYDAIMNHKHVVLLTVETDVVVGPILSKLAQQAGVVYTGTAGDEPGTVKELYDFAIACGYTVRSMGKSPNNVLDFTCTPDSVREEALRRGMNPKMLCSFKDNTKTMVELTAMSNATGLIADVPGCHGGEAEIKDFVKLLSLKSEGGMLDKYGVVEYVGGMAPGVFLTYTTENQVVRDQLKYVNQGDGPNYLLWRPYHLTSLETPISIAMAVLENKPTIIPLGAPVSETLCVAKADLKAGTNLDGIGGFTIRGWIDTHESAVKSNAVPIGLINKNTRLLKDVKQGELITYDMVELEETFICKLRKLQDATFA